MLETFLNGLSTGDGMVLLIASFIGSAMTAAFGVGGGAFLIMVMAGIMPALALIPVHGVVQLGSNASRAVLARQHLDWPRFFWFCLGACAAALVSIWLIGAIDTRWIPLLIAFFVLLITWMPMPSVGLGRHAPGLISGGVLTTLGSMLVGASGPLVSAWLNKDADNRWHYTALFSSVMTVQHLLKILVFGVAGFAFVAWLPLMLAMVVAGYFGTRLGLLLLGKWPESLFQKIYKCCLTLLALRLIFMHFIQ